MVRPATRWTRRAALALIALVKRGKGGLRGFLIRLSPIGYEIAFTPGNLDEPLNRVIAGHREVVRILKTPVFNSLLTEHPTLIYRSYRRYLASSFTKKERREILKQHYLYLAIQVGETFFVDVIRNRPPVWQKSIGSDAFAMTLSFNPDAHQEGDLVLEFQVNESPLYHVSFTIAPGRLTGSCADRVILVGRVQGVMGKLDAIRRATKLFLDVSPPHLLMAAVQGLSLALTINMIAGVKSKEQVTLSQAIGSSGRFDYDGFWRSYECTETERFFLIPVPVLEKPIELIASAHRSRTRSKRNFKAEVAKESELNFSRMLSARSDEAINPARIILDRSRFSVPL